MMMTLNVKLRSDNDSGCQNQDATLKVDLKTDDGSERRTENKMMALNAETKK